MIQRVYERVSGVLDDVAVATDDNRIAAAVEAFGGRVVMTSVGTAAVPTVCARLPTYSPPMPTW